MKKLFLTFFLALCALSLFSSCSSDEDDPIRYGYLYTAAMSNISYDLIDFFDINISFMTTTGVQESYTIKESGQIPQRQIFWERNVMEKGDFTVTLSLKPKTTGTMADDTDYTVSFDLSITAGTVDERDPAGEFVSFNQVKNGAEWKKEGTLTYTQTVTPKY